MMGMIVSIGSLSFVLNFAFAQDSSSALAALPQVSVEAPTMGVMKADSLYNNHQYTQAFDLYHALHLAGNYSPSMLLKMAYIQEGLGRLGESLYYLNLYYLASNDGQALKKMEELAKKNNLEGYETSETIKILAWLQEQYATLAWTIATFCVLLLALLYYLQTTKKTNPSLAGIALALALIVLFVHINFSLSDERGIVAKTGTYLMSGPSAGASVVAIVGEGHQLQIEGREDVWLRVRWKNNDVYVKESLIRPVRL